MKIFRWQCNPVQPSVPAAPVAPTTRWYQSELPPVEADEYKQVCAERDELRRKLDECRADAPKHMRAENQRLRNAAQLFEEQLSNAEDQLAAVPSDAIREMYDAYAHAVAGMDSAAEFPAVGRWLGLLVR